MYGRLGYQVASYCVTLVHGSTHLPVYNAMAMYRNYDGNGGRFGAYSIGAASPNKGVNVYAASDSPTNPTKVWVMLVNVSGAPRRPVDHAEELHPDGLRPGLPDDRRRRSRPRTPSVTITNGTITGFSLAANSVALLVLAK